MKDKMEELELLKKDWNKESDEFKNYSEQEIYKMIKKNSTSVAKFLVLIGLTEISIWSAYGYFEGEFPIVRVVLFVFFFGLVIYLYHRMKAENKSTSLMKNILNLRKVVLGYAGASLFLIIVDHIFHFKYYTRDFMAGIHDGSRGNPYKTTNPDTAFPQFGNYAVFGIVFLVTLYLLYLIYKKTYGKVLTGLRKNYKELSRAE
ncbi:sterol desaturase/sphingolipid hydroxylase (fatty acid hydroxylase superfamily) [Chryseobacterium sp. H1D6B]|uniref:hypothetical protein n=1 Tax=Chryseobacterium sp. H1D6B TaxID=2940588 RepID=UPI0015C73A06|nr:hypothetical protein [Chryseobacterium sp. H1D6B]MDH6250779.1 sterol desaturase/sphingolipid hydroxylase (fatty acid hydroxylase superfamily) [Chryseobacterium sp. H1D6B]